MSINHSRRKLINIAGISFALLAIYKLKYFDHLVRSLSHLFDRPLKNLVSHDFYLLSQDLLGKTEAGLNLDIASKIWIQLNSDSESEYNEQILLLVSEHKKVILKSVPFELTEEFFELHKSAIKTVLRIWYTGVVVKSNQTQERFFYEEALMHSYFYELRLPPGICAGAFGYWSKSPETV